jgi:SAM-dependent methyltransferase
MEMAASIYDTIGLGYRRHRRADPHIAAHILGKLGSAESVLNVGAGAGSYEPSDRRVIAIEPSEIMIGQRSEACAACVRATAEALPFRDGAFDAAMAVLTVHHWPRLAEGLREMRRVARAKVVILTWDPECQEKFWLTRDYLPEILAQDGARFPKLALLAEQLGPLEVEPLLIPHDCTDGFRGAYWRRPEAYLDSEIRQSISSFSQLDCAVVDGAMSCLAADLKSGAWARRNEEILSQDAADLGYRIVSACYKGGCGE